MFVDGTTVYGSVDKELSRATAKGEIGAKLAGGCLTVAIYFIAYFTV